MVKLREFQKHKEMHNTTRGVLLRDMILGGQDGLVNVLGIILGIAIATTDIRIVIIAGIVAAFAESVSMAAVAYTSTKAAKDYYKSEYEREKYEIENMPEFEKKEIREIYYKKGFRGKLLNDVVKKITSNKKIWLETMMTEELMLPTDAKENPVKSAAVVGFSAFIGSLIPLIPFFFYPAPIIGMISSLVLSIIVLFAAGYAKGKITIGKAGRSGAEMAIIGISSAIAGYIIGYLLSSMI
jgi:predicted membrane protein (TIGR00267 family)